MRERKENNLLPDRTSTLKQSFFWSVLVFHSSGWLLFLLPLPYSSPSYTFLYAVKTRTEQNAGANGTENHYLKFCWRGRYSTAICENGGRESSSSAHPDVAVILLYANVPFSPAHSTFFSPPFILKYLPRHQIKERKKKEPCHGHHDEAGIFPRVLMRRSRCRHFLKIRLKRCFIF